MNYRRTARLFFMELVFVLFSFALCAAICVQLFGKAHQLSAHSREASAAAVKAQAAAEAFKAAPTDTVLLCSLLGATVQDGSISVYYDETWQAVARPAPRMLTLSASRDGSLLTAHITVSLHGETLFTLAVSSAILGGDAP